MMLCIQINVLNFFIPCFFLSRCLAVNPNPDPEFYFPRSIFQVQDPDPDPYPDPGSGFMNMIRV